MADQLDPVVSKFVEALNAGDQAAFFDLLTDDATMSDDGNDRGLRQWVRGEVFDSNGRMSIDPETIADGGRAFVAEYANDRWGAMRTAWRFTVVGDKIGRFETGQA
ncbi:nuclear transport factor 2 family protein [Nocardia blacklockiae]|uniref:nuclear transport factor 2 family protein n=1 Tax=Nocardia blacklockiae TaxID=480036 RepID=UPI001895DA0D|nr:nuclear transport factor 2 family protein [Nocardia blacklockiae]MBF6171199.1 nuclear transport factor 2 family protein [Nocardia blacklockiae]